MPEKNAITQRVMPTGTAHAVSFLLRPGSQKTDLPADYGMVIAQSGAVSPSLYTTRANNMIDEGSIRVPLTEGRDLTCLGFHGVLYGDLQTFLSAAGKTCTADIWLEIEHQFKGGAELFEYEYVGKLTLTVGTTQVAAGTLMAPAAARLCSIADPATADNSRDPGIRISGGGANCRSWAKFDHEGATAVIVHFGARSDADLKMGVVCKQV